MNRVHHAKDFSLAIAYGAGQMDQAYVRQWYIPYGVKVGDCGSALFLNNIITDYESGLIVGGAVGVRGAAEYERLIGVLGDGTRNMDSINISHLMVVFAIAAANIRFLWQKTHQKKGVSQNGRFGLFRKFVRSTSNSHDLQLPLEGQPYLQICRQHIHRLLCSTWYNSAI